MTAATTSLRRYFRLVDQANADLGRRWDSVSNHLRYGLTQPVATAAILRKVYQPPNDFPGEDGRRHRKPIRALYGLGQSARDRYDRESAFYDSYCEGLRKQIEDENLAVDYWLERARSGDEVAVRWYCDTLLPSVLPRIPSGAHFQVSGYSAEEQHLVVERYVPEIEVIPHLQRFEIANNMSLREIRLSEQDRASWYLSFISQVALLTVDRVYRTEISTVIDKVTMNCVTVLRNPATGHLETICVLSVSLPRQRFVTLNLLGVDPMLCIRSVNGRMTSAPGQYAPVTPWAEPETQGNVVVTVENTPLLEMSPSDLEQLIVELLRRMGLRALGTGRSGDGGVDCEAYDDRPVVGGKVLVQVKRYSNTVSPSVVRDLFGTIHADGATKGVLITTSGFGPESRQFAQGKPLELIDGIALDGLLRQYGLSGVMAPSPTTESASDLQQALPPISPDGQYYWDGTAWQPIAGARG